jgi:hypothetical protein
MAASNAAASIKKITEKKARQVANDNGVFSVILEVFFVIKTAYKSALSICNFLLILRITI